jgi:two-component system sensor histidine kinase HydH
MRIFRPRHHPRKRRLYLPAITIIMVALTLILMHAVSTFRTLNRERRHWEKFLERNARDIITMVKADMIAQDLEVAPTPEALNKLLSTILGDLDIAYFGLLGKEGRWIAGVKLSRAPPFSLPENKGWDSGGRQGLYRHIRELPDGRRVFEFTEFVPKNNVLAAVVGLWMTPLEEAQREDIRHAFMMGVILLVLGSAAFYFIFVVQNYYLVDRTLAEMKSYTEDVVESMANGLITVDTAGRIVSTNRTATEIFALDKARILGRSLESIVPRHSLDISDVLQQEKWIIENEIECQGDRDTIPCSVSATPLRSPEGVNMGAVIVVRDLREIRELQERVLRSERLASLGRLASGVAHEIRNPLSSIKGFAQYFRDKFDEGTEDKSYATIMIQEVERLNRVITELLDFAKPREPRLRRSLLSEIIQHAFRLIQPDLHKKGIKLTHSQFPEGVIHVDSDLITQALLNIFLNAMESMTDGGELHVEFLERPEKGGVEIWISDTGSGIGGEDRPRVFDPFFSTKKKGTGLGLAITAKIVESHHGEISVESEKGKGTTFKIYLPLAVGSGTEGGEG